MTSADRFLRLELCDAIAADDTQERKDFHAFSFTAPWAASSLLGGLIGVLFGTGLARLVAVFVNFNAIVDVNSILLAFAVGCVIGLFFGFYPAHRAAVLDPIDALRYQRIARRDDPGPLAHRVATGDYVVACRDRRPEFRARCRLSHRRIGESPPRALRFCAGQETSANHPRSND